MKPGKRIALIIISIFILVGIVLGITYATFSGDIIDDAKPYTIKTGDLVLSFEENTASIDASSIEPGWNETKFLSVTNESNQPIVASLVFSELTNDFKDRSDLVYSVTSTLEDVALEKTPIPGADNFKDVHIIKDITFPANATHTFTIKFEFLNKDEVQDDNQKCNFSAKLGIIKPKEVLTSFKTNYAFTEEDAILYTDGTIDINSPTDTSTDPNNNVVGYVGTSAQPTNSITSLLTNALLTKNNQTWMYSVYRQAYLNTLIYLYKVGQLTTENIALAKSLHATLLTGESAITDAQFDEMIEFVKSYPVIKQVIIKEGVQYIGESLFSFMGDSFKVFLPTTTVTVAINSFGAPIKGAGIYSFDVLNNGTVKYSLGSRVIPILNEGLKYVVPMSLYYNQGIKELYLPSTVEESLGLELFYLFANRAYSSSNTAYYNLISLEKVVLAANSKLPIRNLFTASFHLLDMLPHLKEIVFMGAFGGFINDVAPSTSFTDRDFILKFAQSKTFYDDFDDRIFNVEWNYVED